MAYGKLRMMGQHGGEHAPAMTAIKKAVEGFGVQARPVGGMYYRGSIQGDYNIGPRESERMTIRHPGPHPEPGSE